MPRHNRTFQLTINDIDLIEDALRMAKADLAKKPFSGEDQTDPALISPDDRMRQIQDLLGRLHNQKVFYRPDKVPYVSG